MSHPEKTTLSCYLGNYPSLSLDCKNKKCL